MKSETERTINSNKQPRFGKRELLLLAVLFLVILCLVLMNRSLYAAPAARVEVSVIGENSSHTVLETFDLDQDTVFSIVTDPTEEGGPSGTNLLIIKDGKAWISEANCPNQDCVKQGSISMNGEMLVCLPHKVTVSIVGESNENR